MTDTAQRATSRAAGATVIGEPEVVEDARVEGPSAAEIFVWQARTARPLRCTVHAPHALTPQPYLVPRRSSTSRSTQSKGMSAGTSTVVDRPLTVKV